MSPTWNGDLGDPRAYGYTYSSTNGSLSGMTLPGGGAYSYTYDGLRRLNSRSLALNNSPFLTREYGYVPGTGTNDTTTLVSTLTNKKGNGTTLNGWTYTYDAAGQITSISDGTDIWSYTYDKQGQLLTETKGTGDDARTWTYSYDTGGNLRSVTTPGISITPIQPPWPRPTFEPMGDGDGEGDEEDDLAPLEISHTFTYSYGNAQWPDLLTAYNDDPITYDASGNPTEWYDGAEMSWAHGRQLVSISATNDHAALSFSYDNSGLRLTKTVGTGTNAVEHRYTWQGSKLIAEAFEDTELEFFYDESGAPYALLVRDTSTATPTESWYYYVTNLQGDVVMLLDASGNIAAEYSYNAWGEILSSAGTMADVNPIRYRGYYYDAETGLYYLHSRYYDPVVGRFLNADAFASTGQGILGSNMFAYCGNCPVNGYDPSGCLPWYLDTDGNGHEIPKYRPINGQMLEPYASIPYGNSTIGYSGCEALSCYTLLGKLGVSESLDNVISFFENRFSNNLLSGWGMGGKWGATPTDIACFLDSRGIQYIILSNNDFIELDYYGPASGYYIMSYWNGMPYLSSYHTILLECDGCDYTAYNWKVSSKRSYKRDHFWEYLPNNLWKYSNINPSVLSVYYIPEPRKR